MLTPPAETQCHSTDRRSLRAAVPRQELAASGLKVGADGVLLPPKPPFSTAPHEERCPENGAAWQAHTPVGLLTRRSALPCVRAPGRACQPSGACLAGHRAPRLG